MIPSSRKAATSRQSACVSTSASPASKAVEDLVNKEIEAKLPITCEEMTVAEAKAQGAIGLFDNKYGEKVKVYSMGDFSKEICGGPHAQNTGDLGHFVIKKEEASSSGVRRIKAVLVKD